MQSLILTALNSYLERLWYDVQGEGGGVATSTEPRVTESAIVRRRGGLQNKMQPVIRARRRSFVNICSSSSRREENKKKKNTSEGGKQARRLHKTASGMMITALSLSLQNGGGKKKVLPSPLICRAQKTR